MRSAKKMMKQMPPRRAKKTNPVAIAKVSFDNPLQANQSIGCEGTGGGGSKMLTRIAVGLLVDISIGDSEGLKEIVSFSIGKTVSLK